MQFGQYHFWEQGKKKSNFSPLIWLFMDHSDDRFYYHCSATISLSLNWKHKNTVYTD